MYHFMDIYMYMFRTDPPNADIHLSMAFMNLEGPAAAYSCPSPGTLNRMRGAETTICGTIHVHLSKAPFEVVVYYTRHMGPRATCVLAKSCRVPVLTLSQRPIVRSLCCLYSWQNRNLSQTNPTKDGVCSSQQHRPEGCHWRSCASQGGFDSLLADCGTLGTRRQLCAVQQQ